MFKKNKYTKWYYKIIENARSKTRNRKDEYYENHHIIPKSMGGNNKKDNTVLLTAKEHFICHLLLSKMCENANDTYKMIWALHRISFKDKKITSGQYSLVRKMHSDNLKTNSYKKRDIEYTNKLSEIVKSHWAENPQRRDSQREKQFEHWNNLNEEEYLIRKEKNKINSKKGVTRLKEILETDPDFSKRKIREKKQNGTYKTRKYYPNLSEEHKKILSENASSRRWVNDGEKSFYIKEDDLDKYLSSGYKRGRHSRKKSI